MTKMSDRSYQAIVDAMDKLANGTPESTNGKITGVNLAVEARVSKATLYRYLTDFPQLQEAYSALRHNGIKRTTDAPETLQQANKLIQDEVKYLRIELKKLKKETEELNKLKSHQIQLLWLDNERLQMRLNLLLKNSDGRRGSNSQ